MTTKQNERAAHNADRCGRCRECRQGHSCEDFAFRARRQRSASATETRRAERAEHRRDWTAANAHRNRAEWHRGNAAAWQRFAD